MFDRKAAWIERMFDRLFTAIQKNPFAALLVLSVALNLWQYNINNEVNRLRIADITSFNERIVIEVRKGVQSELPKQLAPYKEQQDSNTSKLDTSLVNLDQTLQSLKQYFNKNKKK